MIYKSYKSKVFFSIFTLCRLGEIMVAPPQKIVLPPLTFSPKSGLGNCFRQQKARLLVTTP